MNGSSVSDSEGESNSGNDDPGTNPYMTRVACLKVHLRLENRLTTVENKLATLQILNAGSIIAAIATLAGIAYVVWHFATGH
jgi:hypothetical protein